MLRMIYNFKSGVSYKVIKDSNYIRYMTNYFAITKETNNHKEINQSNKNSTKNKTVVHLVQLINKFRVNQIKNIITLRMSFSIKAGVIY